MNHNKSIPTEPVEIPLKDDDHGDVVMRWSNQWRGMTGLPHLAELSEKELIDLNEAMKSDLFRKRLKGMIKRNEFVRKLNAKGK